MTIDAWTNFLIAQCGASAALLGLLFVSISLNLSRILAYPQLPSRALLAMLLLLTILLIASLLLIPGQSVAVNGVEVLVPGILIGGAGAVAKGRDFRRSSPVWRFNFVRDSLFFAIATAPYLVAGVLLLTGGVAALYWLAAAMILSIVKSMTDAWVLLVEINR